MLRVILHTHDGQQVATVLVPPYQPMPEVLMWGQRMFARDDNGCYREAMTTAVWTAEELAEQGRGVPAKSVRDYGHKCEPAKANPGK